MPRFSVIIPVYRDPNGLRDTLLSLGEQSYPADGFELIVVDNGSDDDTVEVARALAAELPCPVTVAVEHRRGSYAARNAGIRLATGEILCFIDADVVAEPEFLGQIEQCFDDPAVDYVGCRIVVETRVPTLSGHFDALFGTVQSDYLESGRFAVTAGMCVRRSVVDAVGGFDARLESSGDKEFGERVHDGGFRQVYARHVVLRHPSRATYGALASQSRRIGRGFAQMAFHHPERYDGLEASHRRVRTYLPLSPRWVVYAMTRATGRRPPVLTTLALSFWGVPLTLLRLWSYHAERRRLEKERGRGLRTERRRPMDGSLKRR